MEATHFIFLSHSLLEFYFSAQNSRYVNAREKLNVWRRIIAAVLTFVTKALEILMGEDPCGSRPGEANREQIMLV